MHSPTGAKQRWLLVYNCHANGLANCLGTLSDDIAVEIVHRHQIKRKAVQPKQRMPDYDLVLVAPQLAKDLGVTGDEANVWLLPAIQFRAYHPDTCYVARNTQLRLKGPMGEYHSLIALTAFQMGLGVEDAKALYREEIYQALGYFDVWDTSRADLTSRFRLRGFDIDSSFVGWSRRGAFMHTINHPRIECLVDLATCILTKAGLEPVPRQVVPHDNLANGPIYPVYPEIGSRLGVQGSYAFKIGGAYEFLDLDTFIRESYAVYAEASLDDLVPSLQASISVARRAIEGIA